MSETIYPKGIRVFPKHQNAPDFVKGTVIITPNELFTFCKENVQLMTEYNGQKQLRCQLLDGNNGLYMSVDTYKPEAKKEPEKSTLPPSEMADSETEDLPF